MTPLPVALVFGTRPEAVKLLEPIRVLAADGRFAPKIVLTGQHREMVDEILRPFGITADADLAIMQPGQTLNDIVCRAMPRLDELYRAERPAIVLVQGDTTSAMCAALAAFHLRIPVGHVEAGLRSFNRFHPYPEEANRRMITSVADLHFVPTTRAAQNVLDEGVPRADVIVTGNTVVDALRATLREQRPAEPVALRGDGRLVLVTLHRREGWDQAGRAGGSVLDDILGAIQGAARAHPSVDFVYPVHLNPKVRGPAEATLGGEPNVRLVPPMAYIPFVHLMARASLILSDSGGVQEEAPSLGVPVLVLRRTTERPEGLGAGNRLVGTEPARIRAAIDEVLAATPAFARSADAASREPRPSPFGDGRASLRMRDAILARFGLGASATQDRPADAVSAELGSPTDLAALRPKVVPELEP